MQSSTMQIFALVPLVPTLLFALPPRKAARTSRFVLLRGQLTDHKPISAQLLGSFLLLNIGLNRLARALDELWRSDPFHEVFRHALQLGRVDCPVEAESQITLGNAVQWVSLWLTSVIKSDASSSNRYCHGNCHPCCSRNAMTNTKWSSPSILARPARISRSSSWPNQSQNSPR